jgi:hypothetical protein
MDNWPKPMEIPVLFSDYARKNDNGNPGKLVNLHTGRTLKKSDIISVIDAKSPVVISKDQYIITQDGQLFLLNDDYDDYEVAELESPIIEVLSIEPGVFRVAPMDNQPGSKGDLIYLCEDGRTWTLGVNYDQLFRMWGCIGGLDLGCSVNIGICKDSYGSNTIYLAQEPEFQKLPFVHEIAQHVHHLVNCGATLETRTILAYWGSSAVAWFPWTMQTRSVLSIVTPSSIWC